MVKEASEMTLKALGPGVYHYKFVLDEAEWTADPANPERIHDGVGGDNSILRVSG